MQRHGVSPFITPVSRPTMRPASGVNNNTQSELNRMWKTASLSV